MIILAPEQRTMDWFAARAGRLTGSRAADMLATIKSGEAAARRDLRLQLVVEQLTGQPQEDGYCNAVMQRGLDKEPDAFRMYEALTGHVAQPVGFVAHDTLAAGCSPDGQIDDFRGILEVKCPKSATHLRYIKTGGLPAEYRPQVTHNLWVTGALWCDFLSFDDRFPPPLQVFRVRVMRDELDLTAYELAVRLFLAEVQRDIAEVTALAGAAA